MIKCCTQVYMCTYDEILACSLRKREYAVFITPSPPNCNITLNTVLKKGRNNYALRDKIT